MKQLWILCIIFLSLSVFGQTIKRQVGTSVWTMDNKILAESKTGYIISYDKHQHKISEWRIFRDISGRIADTFSVDFDTTERIIHCSNRIGHWFCEYDSLGNREELIVYGTKDTVKINFPLNETSYPAETPHIAFASNTSAQDTVMSSGRSVIDNAGTDKWNQWNFIESFANVDGKVNTEILNYFDGKNNVSLQVKKKDGKVLKRTAYYYRRGIEEFRIEEFFGPDYKVTTYFNYEYW